MNIAIIPARGGSKRVKKKNIKLFLDTPIISYSIKIARQSNLFDKIMCACNMGTRGLRRIARTDMYMAKTYDDWRKSAAELDELSGNTLWRSIAEGAEYDFEVVNKSS